MCRTRVFLLHALARKQRRAVSHSRAGHSSFAPVTRLLSSISTARHDGPRTCSGNVIYGGGQCGADWQAHRHTTASRFPHTCRTTDDTLLWHLSPSRRVTPHRTAARRVLSRRFVRRAAGVPIALAPNSHLIANPFSDRPIDASEKCYDRFRRVRERE